MCGIAGYIGKRVVPDAAVRQTLELMRRRGPDHQAFVRRQKDGVHAVMLHARLKIIDLDPRANQPFVQDDYTVVFNGEVYNYLELRMELQQRGIALRTHSDTEVLLWYYILHGAACVNYFEGMWAFAVYNAADGTCFLARDRFAEKPLYFHEAADGFFFGSEIKYLAALAGHRFPVNQSQLLRYMVNGYKALYKCDETFFTGVREWPFACSGKVSAAFRAQPEPYWHPGVHSRNMALPEAVAAFREALLKSVRLRLRADVPLAFCLSGGVDSAAIVSIAAKCFQYDVATFSIIDKDERYNERDNIEATLQDLKCRHTLIETSTAGFFERLAQLVQYHDAPVATISYYVHSFLSEAVAAQGFKVVCSGTAADELVTGYYDHMNLYLYEMRHSPRLPQYLAEWRLGMGRFVRNPHLKNPRLYFEQPGFREHVYLDREVFAGFMRVPFDEAFKESVFTESLLKNRMLNELFYEGTRVILHEDDLNSMYYSVENRSPYLDRALFDAAYAIPVEYLVQRGVAKFILREAVKGILNDQVRLDTRKRGFNASINSLVDGSDPATRALILGDSPIYDLVDREKIAALLPQAPMPNSLSKFLFYFLNAKTFLELNG